MFEMAFRLQQIRSGLDRGEEAPYVSVRELLSWFGAKRRGYWVVDTIRQALDEAGIATDPDFEPLYMDAPVTFVRTSGDSERTEPAEAKLPDSMSSTSSIPAIDVVYSDPAYRLSKLAAANQRVVATNPDARLEEAVTLMMVHDFSQLPVMSGQREVKGAISWRSIARRKVLDIKGDAVREFMEQPAVLPASASLFEAIPVIVDSGYVLVKGPDLTVVGIVTASDLSLQFRQVAEPFLLLSEIENHLRGLLNGKFTADELLNARDPQDKERTVTTVADLTFGEYIRLLEDPKRWKRLGLALDRTLFVDRLRAVGRTRNDVMHFDPDGVPDEELDQLRDFARLLHELKDIGAV